ncbi:hypothetical protein LB450_08660 [Psychroflexus sp. CAK1W]|uniref:hypothetical protein n=1 Tax=Psychroflexus curvus TaxID=2873595 RepID=UPI001CCF9801|nr:hypothetical protein [Psychroflexus curvus]MBZ9628167.1 hypothetical protein [Psychroflexus curvus]
MKKLKNIILIIVGLIVVYYAYDYFKTSSTPVVSEEAKATKETFEKSLREKKNANDYNLEETIRIVHGLENAKEYVNSSSEYLQYLSKQDYSKVAPDVIEAKKKLIPLLNKLQKAEKRLEDSSNLWETFSVVSNIMADEGSTIALKASLSGGLDPSMATELISGSKKLFNMVAENNKINDDLKNIISDVEEDYLKYSIEFYPIYLKYMKEWDKVCLIRDNAYLSIHQGNINSALISLDRSLEINETDSESLIMKAFCHLYKYQNSYDKNPENLRHSNLETAKSLIDRYLNLYPDRSAPALLLLGSYHFLKGNESKAINFYNQSSVEYPKQANLLLDMLNSYKQRSYLRKTAEGMYIVELYKSMMQGFGFFSPNFQKSLIAYNEGDYEESKEEIIRHFFRRGNQGIYDFLISDMNHFEAYLPESFNMIFEEKSFFNLIAETTMFSSDKLNIKIENNSDININNVRVFLCVHFTDMYKSDYEVFKVENTINTIPAYSTADFGDLEIDFNLYGKQKSLDEDIVTARAIILTDDLIAWVDEKDFKIIKAKEAYKNNTDLETVNRYLSKQNLNDSQLKYEIVNNSIIEINEKYIGTDEIKLFIPRKIINFNPIFSINELNTVEGLKPDRVKLNGSYVELTFLKNIPEDKKIDFYINTEKFIINWEFEFTNDNKFINSDFKYM